ncbi:unnamed protein product [marine sediment metagenome]|uniref:Uncharacterized protein n=1 Tax=marine sediment metagenome TaxID=412755 RepID=X1RGY0_9ZZZZ
MSELIETLKRTQKEIVDRNHPGWGNAVLWAIDKIDQLEARNAELEAVIERLADNDRIAREFHDMYEWLAPNYGYNTRHETREYDSLSPNGRLMLETCDKVVCEYARKALEE